MSMNLEGGTYAHCVRHPSEFFTGFCSSCLVERLCNVDAVKRNPNPSPQTLNEIVEISTDSERNHNGVRVRKTLLSLFQLDDGNGVDVEIEDHKGLEEQKSESAGSSSRFPAMGLKWRSVSKRALVEDGCFNCMIGAKHLERKQSLHNSSDDSKDGLEKPRYSWDGSVMSKALTCSFTWLEEPQDGSSRIRRGEEATNESEFSRKKSHRWSRVWDWSITSPFRDFGKKHEHVLDRSLSNSWPGSRSNAEPESGNGQEIQKLRPDWQKKREYRFGRSRSVHYSSPRNVDNGLLRFYLTPMRTSRRATSKGRTKTSRFLTKGILGT